MKTSELNFYNFHILNKPSGPACNLDCTYCFYLEKEKLYDPDHRFRMSDELAETYVRQYIEGQAGDLIQFAFQGGEPTLMGLRFFEKVLMWQEKYLPAGKRIENSMQTNGTLLDDRWGEFLSKNKFLVGISIDGPEHLHNRFRTDKGGAGTHHRVMNGVNILKKYKVEFNTLTVVNRVNQEHPLDVYHFLKSIGSQYMQFIPLVEREGDDECLANPPKLGRRQHEKILTDWAVEAPAYGRFMCTIWDEWVKKDIGTTFVQLFDTTLSGYLGQPPGLCYFSPVCGSAGVVEHNGDIYACDHYVYPEFKRGNIKETSLRAVFDSPEQKQFGLDKREKLPPECLDCRYLKLCNGECPKHRFVKSKDGKTALNYLCPAYKTFFAHTESDMTVMAQLIRSGKTAADIRAVKENQARVSVPSSKNATCSCGSGKKYKHCCGKQ